MLITKVSLSPVSTSTFNHCVQASDIILHITFAYQCDPICLFRWDLNLQMFGWRAHVLPLEQTRQLNNDLILVRLFFTGEIGCDTLVS